MILTGASIIKGVESGAIVVDPFVAEHVQPNSYDVRLGTELIHYSNQTLDVRVEQPIVREIIPPEGYLVRPDRIYLGSTAETIGSEHFVPIIRARSSIARLGLFVHVTADLIDIGSVGQLTLQLHAVQPVRIYAGMRIAQVTFWCVDGPIELYQGKYQGSVGPQPSRAYLDSGATA